MIREKYLNISEVFTQLKIGTFVVKHRIIIFDARERRAW